MRKSRTSPPDASELRRVAEERVARRQVLDASAAGADPRRLLHELEVHQIELELQNEELRAARQQIESGLQRYTELFDFAPIGYLVIAADGTIRETNLTGARLLGTERQRLVGQPLSHFVSEGDRGAWHGFLRRVLGRTAWDDVSEACEVTLAAPGSGSRGVHLTATALDGETPTALVAVEDVTERRHAEAEVREEARRKDEFLAVLSHELRNPLMPIGNSLHVLDRATPGGPQAREAKAILDRQVAHLSRLVDDLLDLTRIAQGKILLQRERVELGALVRCTLDDHRAGFEAHGLRLDAHLADGPFWLDADATRIVQVIGNLLGNAVKFTPRGGKVDVVLRREGPRVALAVRDSGVGIAPEVRARLFVPFRQAPQTLDRTRGGLGLGLAMVKGLVELHGGTVELVSEGLGRGAEFTIRLPLQAAPAEAARPAEPRRGAHRRILLIEDNPDAADSLRQVLELEGHEVVVAYDGPTGLALARDTRPEIIVCDIGLPGMDGYAVARALRAEDVFKGTVLIALSGYAQSADLQHAVDAGFDRHVAKPPNLDQLCRLLAEA